MGNFPTTNKLGWDKKGFFPNQVKGNVTIFRKENMIHHIFLLFIHLVTLKTVYAKIPRKFPVTKYI